MGSVVSNTLPILLLASFGRCVNLRRDRSLNFRVLLLYRKIRRLYR